MKNLHKDNIHEVTEKISNISINDQNVHWSKFVKMKAQTVSFSLNDEMSLLKY